MINKKNVLRLLSDFIAIKSISTNPQYAAEINKSAAFLADLLTKTGFKTKTLYSPISLTSPNTPKLPSNPLIFASYDIGAPKTIAIYSHYDVQPASKSDGWSTDPFKLTQKNNKFYGRGIADDKGHLIQNIVSVINLIKTNQLKNNIIFLFEGEEEIGSTNFEKYCRQLNPLLSNVDVFYITDVGVHDRLTPQIFYGLRGIVGFELTITTGKKELHSGIYGNRVYNAAEIMSYIISRLKNPIKNHVLIDGFYDQFKLQTEEITRLKPAIISEKRLLNQSQSFKLITVDNLPTSLASKIYPSLDINSLSSGYLGVGAKNIIPNTATLKVTCRLVENQTADEIKQKIEKYIKKIVPSGVKYHLTFHGLCQPFYMKTNHPEIKKTAQLLTSSFQHPTIFNRSGGSIPATERIQRLYKKPTILTGFTNPDSNIHSIDENYDINLFYKGIEIMYQLYS